MELELEVMSALRRIVRAIDLHSHKLVEQYGLTGPQLVTLQAACRLDGASAGAIARSVNLSCATVSGILDRLERRGLIRRERSRTDRRSVNVVVTDDGLAALEQAPSLLQERFQTEFQKLERWEQTLMLSTLQRVALMMHAGELDAAPVLVTGSVTEPAPSVPPLPTPGQT